MITCIADNGDKVIYSINGTVGDPNFGKVILDITCLLYTSPSPRDRQKSRMPSSA